MRHLRLFALAIWALAALLQPAWAQKNKDFASLVEEADRNYRTRQYDDAERLYRLAVRQDPGNYYLIRQIAYCNALLDKLEESVKWYQTAVDLDPNRSDTTWFDYARVLKKMGNYAESNQMFQRFIDMHKRNDYLLRTAKLDLEGNKFAEQALKNPKEFEVKRISLNNRYRDYSPAIYQYQSTRFIIFTSHRAGNLGKARLGEAGDEPYSDLWVAKLTSDTTFGAPQNMGKMVNTIANDGSATISPDGTMLYYSICGGGRVAKEYGAGCSIYMSQFDEKKKNWGRFTLVEGINGSREVQVNSAGKTRVERTWDSHPCLSPDGNTLYFSSDRMGGVGGIDIWYSTKAGNSWTPPVNAGRTINTEFSELTPKIAEDGKTMYFASNGHIGFGGYDVYKTQGLQSTWTEPENMGAPVNTSYDDLGLIWVEQDSIGFLNSNRPGSSSTDIYQIRRHRRVVKKPIEITVQGRVRDTKSKQTIPFATVTLFLMGGDNTITPLDTFKTDQTGVYKFTLEKGNDYKLVGNAPEYLPNEVFVSTKNIEETTRLERDIDIFLERIEVNRPIVLQNIYYDFDKADLRPESIMELDRVAKMMKDNPGITIQIAAHTDTNGSEPYNVKLSNRRAKSVVDYLVGQGVSAKRITWFGYGESQPLVYPEMSDADEQTNRRSEFRIKTLDITQQPQ